MVRQRAGGPDEKWEQRVLDYVSEHGFSDLTLGKLAKELGVSKPSLNYQFGSLEQLYGTLADRFAEQDARILRDIFKQSQGITDFLRRVLHGFLVAPTAPVTRLELLSLSARKPEIFRDYRREAREKVRAFMRPLLKQDGCPEAQMDAMSDLAINVFNGGIVQYLIEQDMEKIDDTMDLFSSTYGLMRESWGRASSESGAAIVSANKKSAPAPVIAGIDLEDFVDDLRQRHGVVGATLGVLADGDIHQVSSGLLSLESGVECTPDSVFQIGSIGKVFTATVIMQLVDEGRLELDAPVAAYVPGFMVADAFSAHTITVRQLLNHTSGLDGDFFPQDDPAGPSVASYVQKMALLPNLFAPGEGPATYSNAAYVVAGRVIEVLTGKSWQQAIMDRVCKPLGMNKAFANPAEALRYRCAMGHLPGPEGAMMAAPMAYLPQSIAPAGSVLSMSVDNLLTFTAAHMGDGAIGRGAGAERLLSKKSARAMRTDTIALQPFSRRSVSHWGLGWFVGDYPDYRMFGHDGSTLGQFSYLRAFPEHKVAFALLTNSRSEAMFADVEHSLMTALVKAEPAKEPGPKRAAENLQRYEGCYENVSTRYTVSLRDKTLYFSFRNSAAGVDIEGTLQPYRKGVFTLESDHPLAANEKVVFLGGDSGQAEFARIGMRMAKRIG